MGLLDDAIRDHLELKRRHGASDEEVGRLEREVLGPVPRPAARARQPEPELDSEVEPDAAAEPAEPEPVAEVHDLPEDDLAPPTVEATIDPAARGFADDDPWLDDPDEVPASDNLHHSRRGQPTTEFTPEDIADAEGSAEFVEPDEDDVLEETPDFLQETPEHDRLWFEQKPPRDFDFNG